MYRLIIKEQNNYKYKILIISFFSAIFIVLSFIISDLIRNRYDFLINYFIPLFFLIIALSVFIYTKNIFFFSNIAIIICIIGFVLTCILPNSRDAYILIFFCFPILAFELTGIKMGIIWSVVSGFFSSFFLILHFTKIIKPWNINFNFSQYIMAIVAFFIISAILFFSLKQNNKYIKNLVLMNRNLVNEEKKLSNLTDFLQKVIDTTPSMMIGTNRSGIICNWNKFSEKITGISRLNAIGKNIFELLEPINLLKDDFEQVKITGEIYSCEKVELQINQTKYFKVIIFPVYTNRDTMIVFNLTDITEIELLDQKLRLSEKMALLGTLSGGLVHDFNNAMTAIISPVSLLKMSISNITEEESSYFECIDIGLNQMTGIISQLKSLSDNKETTFEKIDLNLALKLVNKILYHKLDHSIKIKIDYFPGNPFILGNIVQIEEVILNLCINSSHAMTIMRENIQEKGGILNISISKEKINCIDASFIFNEEVDSFKPGYYYCITVEDNGVGIQKENIKKVFEPFFTTKKGFGGTGFGLSMVSNLIKKHSGIIQINSIIDSGTRISIYLPEYKDNLSNI